MQGIVVIAFGKHYDKMAAYTVGYSQRFTNLPFCIMTNVTERHPKWGACENVTFKHFDYKDNQNRILKTTLVDHTPFEKTIYLDCDAVIQKEGAEELFKHNNDMVFNEYCSWKPGDRIPRLYAELFAKHGISKRVSIFSGGCFVFNKSSGSSEFFNIWNRAWIDEGKGREMHCLAVAVINSGVNYVVNTNMFSPDMLNDKLIQHQCKGWHDKFGIPQIKEDKTCMNIHSTHYQWNMVEFQ